MGRGGSLLLNVPPDRRGLLHENDVRSLAEFGKLRREIFATDLARGARAKASNVRGKFRPRRLLDGDGNTYWSSDDAITTPSVIFDLPKRSTFDVVRLREYIQLGQRVEAFTIDAWDQNDWRTIAEGTSIGACRLLRLAEPVTASRVRLRVTESPVCPALSGAHIRLILRGVAR